MCVNWCVSAEQKQRIIDSYKKQEAEFSGVNFQKVELTIQGTTPMACSPFTRPYKHFVADVPNTSFNNKE